MISVEFQNIYSNLLIFKFQNYHLNYPDYLNDILSFSNNSGNFKEIECINTLGKSSYKNIFILGLGITEEFNSSTLFKCLGKFFEIYRNKIENIDILDNFSEDLAYTLGETVGLALYNFEGIKEIPNTIKLKNVNIISNYKENIKKGIYSSEGINLGRALVNYPSNLVTPKYLTQQSKNIAKNLNLDIKIYDKYMLEKLGMNSILNVGIGSIHDPFLITLQYLGDPENKNITALVGKGITFDSGGISLKPSKNMNKMTSDMAGAASVISTMYAMGKIKPKKNVIGIIPVAENMPSSKSYKPGDIIKTYSGKTVEIISTDAEGRMILCDAITYAKELGVSEIIDIATLTGSAANFFGDINIAMSSNSNKLSKKIIESGKEVGENFFTLPNNIEYMKQLETPNADLKNTGTSCGAIVAGLFLQSFCEDVPFAHLDIAGCATCDKFTDTYEPGATGKPSRTLINYLMK